MLHWLLLASCASPPVLPPSEGGGGIPDGEVVVHLVAGPTEATVVKAPAGHVLEVVVDGRAAWSVHDGDPDRVALSPDGAQVAWFAGVDGFPALHVAGARDGRARVLTNRDLVRRKGGPPEGFVPPPRHEGDLIFDGPVLRWTVDGAEQEVPWSSR